MFLFLLFLIPQYIDISEIGVDLDIELLISIILVFPLVSSLNDAYKKALEIKNIDISALNNEGANGARMTNEELRQGVQRYDEDGVPMKGAK